MAEDTSTSISISLSRRAVMKIFMTAFFYSKSSVINDFKQFYFEIQA